MNSSQPYIFGEVLFDCFPDGSRVLGGAPFNVAWHLQAFGQAPRMVSRVGDDDLGLEIQSAMSDWGMDTSLLQLDETLPTGQVTVTLVDDEPQYEIVRPAAWDAIEALAPTSSCALLYHGSLATRDRTSASALQTLIDAGPQRVFVDVNLRPPWWQREAVLAQMSRADWIKINGDELSELIDGKDTAERIADVVDRYQPKGLIVTHGSAGAEIITLSGEHYSVQPEKLIEVVDTVGAGDAFTAVMLLGLLRDWDLSLTAERAQSFASAIVGRRGATVNDFGFYQAFIDDWRLGN